MLALQFWKTVTADHVGFLEQIVAVLEDSGGRYCVIGGQGVNAYASPVVSLDLDVVVATDDVARAREALAARFDVEDFEHSINISLRGSDLRVQIQRDPRYAAFVEGAQRHTVLGLDLPVARIEDVLQGKVWAAMDPTRRASKRQKDLADIARLIEVRPELRARVPAEILNRLV